MAIEIDSIDDMKQHLSGVMERADHHALEVYKIVLPLVGLIAWKADKIVARTHEGTNANMIWFESGEKRFAVVSNHNSAKIDIRERNQQGKVLMQLDNRSDLDSLIGFFESI